jgi:metal-responsive CopG/Arc/MetJ family transcriptional regulator
MRLHISLDDELVEQLDELIGRRQRSAFIAKMLHRALDEARRWDDVEAGIGALAGREHEWDADPAAWVHAQRFGDPTRVG